MCPLKNMWTHQKSALIPNAHTGKWSRGEDHALTSGPHSVSQWFNTAAFSQNPAVAGNPVDGNSPNYFINSPAFHSVDLTLARTFPIREKVNFQFRAEATNAFNIASYTAPGNTVKTGTFGVITGANTQRQVQIGGKVNF
jgi:hypothetical protein